jgi:hypothetical protein
MNMSKKMSVGAPQSPLQERVTHWIQQLEAQAMALFADVQIEDLSTKERIDLGLKVMTQLQRFVSLGQQLEVGTQSNRTSAALATLMRQMRGEEAPANAPPPEDDEHERESEEEEAAWSAH